MSISLATEQQVAIAAVKRACTLTASVFNKLVKNETLVKGDKSPVTGTPTPLSIRHLTDHERALLILPKTNLWLTVGDFSAQAVVNAILARAFPGDAIVGEEDAKDLRTESGADLRSRVIELATETLSADLGLGEMAEWGLGPGKSWTEEELLGAIDLGTAEGGPKGREYMARRSLLHSVFLSFFLLSMSGL